MQGMGLRSSTEGASIMTPSLLAIALIAAHAAAGAAPSPDADLHAAPAQYPFTQCTNDFRPRRCYRVQRLKKRPELEF
jgi:hypothetical protein